MSRTKTYRPSREAVKEFSFNACLLLAAVLVVVGVAQIFAPAGFVAAGLALAGAGWWFFTGGDESAEEPPR